MVQWIFVVGTYKQCTLFFTSAKQLIRDKAYFFLFCYLLQDVRFSLSVLQLNSFYIFQLELTYLKSVSLYFIFHLLGLALFHDIMNFLGVIYALLNICGNNKTFVYYYDIMDFLGFIYCLSKQFHCTSYLHKQQKYGLISCYKLKREIIGN